MVHVGVDLHTRMSQIAVLNADGELTQHRLPNDLAHLEPFFARGWSVSRRTSFMPMPWCPKTRPALTPLPGPGYGWPMTADV
jgi:hypothetical protein